MSEVIIVWISRAQWIDGVYWCERDVEVLEDDGEADEKNT